MKKFFMAMLMALLILPAAGTFAANSVKVPEEIFKWVQSTPRGNYYFNQKIIGYYINKDDTLDLNILVVPTICTYDEIQIQDVVQKRRWHKKSVTGYNDLIGRADYIQFDFKNNTVQIVRRADLDHTFTELDADTSGRPIKLSELSSKSVACKFYREILIWARKNNEMIIKRSRGKLTARDTKLKPEDMPIFKIDLPGTEE